MFVTGPTGSGKSIVLNVFFSTGYRCQRLLVDTKDEFTIDGVDPVNTVDDIDWDAPVIHYIDDRGDLKEYNRLFRACLQRKAGRAQGPRHYGLVVCVHELADLCGDSPGATPQFVSAYIRKGRAHGLGLLGGSQRPVCMPKAAMTEAQHAIVCTPELRAREDRQAVARTIGLTERDFDDVVARAAATSPTGEHGLVCWDQRTRIVSIRPPLPAHMVAESIVRGLAA